MSWGRLGLNNTEYLNQSKSNLRGTFFIKSLSKNEDFSWKRVFTHFVTQRRTLSPISWWILYLFFYKTNIHSVYDVCLNLLALWSRDIIEGTVGHLWISENKFQKTVYPFSEIHRCCFSKLQDLKLLGRIWQDLKLCLRR